jgi:hypothetical protein
MIRVCPYEPQWLLGTSRFVVNGDFYLSRSAPAFAAKTAAGDVDPWTPEAYAG